jgi:hypothetical protein
MWRSGRFPIPACVDAGPRERRTRDEAFQSRFQKGRERSRRDGQCLPFEASTGGHRPPYADVHRGRWNHPGGVGTQSRRLLDELFRLLSRLPWTAPDGVTSR